MFYFYNYTKSYIPRSNRGLNEGSFSAKDLVVQTTRNTEDKCGDNGTREFIFLSTQTQTLKHFFVNCKKLTTEEVFENPCHR